MGDRYSSPKSFMRKIGLRHFDKLSASLRSANNIRWLSEVEASHNSFYDRYFLD